MSKGDKRIEKVPERELAEYTAIYYELATKYGLADICPLTKEDAVKSILENRARSKQARRYAQKLGKAIARHRDTKIANLLRGH